MHTIVAVNYVKKECIEDFKKLVQELVVETKKEVGCIAYDLYQNLENETELTFIESWETKAHLDAHIVAPHCKRIFPLMEKMTEKPVAVTAFKKC